MTVVTLSLLMCVGNIGFPGLSAAQDMGRQIMEGMGTLGYDRGSLEGCDFLWFCIDLSHKTLICPSRGCLLICKSTTQFSVSLEVHTPAQQRGQGSS
jgi:hypothetical protein